MFGTPLHGSGAARGEGSDRGAMSRARRDAVSMLAAKPPHAGNSASEVLDRRSIRRRCSRSSTRAGRAAGADRDRRQALSFDPAHRYAAPRRSADVRRFLTGTRGAHRSPASCRAIREAPPRRCSSRRLRWCRSRSSRGSACTTSASELRRHRAHGRRDRAARRDGGERPARQASRCADRDARARVDREEPDRCGRRTQAPERGLAEARRGARDRRGRARARCRVGDADRRYHAAERRAVAGYVQAPRSVATGRDDPRFDLESRKLLLAKYAACAVCGS